MTATKPLPSPDPGLTGKPPLVIHFDQLLRIIGPGSRHDQLVEAWNTGNTRSREALVQGLEFERVTGRL
jgi:hypothetical protein